MLHPACPTSAPSSPLRWPRSARSTGHRPGAATAPPRQGPDVSAARWTWRPSGCVPCWRPPGRWGKIGKIWVLKKDIIIVCIINIYIYYIYIYCIILYYIIYYILYINIIYYILYIIYYILYIIYYIILYYIILYYIILYIWYIIYYILYIIYYILYIIYYILYIIYYILYIIYYILYIIYYILYIIYYILYIIYYIYNIILYIYVHRCDILLLLETGTIPLKHHLSQIFWWNMTFRILLAFLGGVV